MKTILMPEYFPKEVLIKEALCFDDVLLDPQYSEIESRQNVSLYFPLYSNLVLDIPIISANMDTVTELRMLYAMRSIGAYGYIHRFMSDEERLNLASRPVFEIEHPAMSIGAGEKELILAKQFIESGCTSICIDIAHGDSKLAIEQTKKLKDWTRQVHTEVDVCAGNIVTAEGAERLINAGATLIKVGVGPGRACQTRIVTGHGYPQLSAIARVAKLKERYMFDLIADGGIRNSGDCVKALAAGADLIMIGSLLAGCHESPSPATINNHGKVFKEYRGMASTASQKARGPDYRIRAPEGISMKIPSTGSVIDVVNLLADGIRSGCSYSGAKNLYELREKSVFVKVTPSSVIESNPRP